MIVGTAIGGIGMIADGLATLNERGPSRVSPFLLPHMIPDAASGMVAIQYGIRGPNLAVVSACATGGHAIGEAMETIVRGQADLMLGAGHRGGDRADRVRRLRPDARPRLADRPRYRRVRPDHRQSRPFDATRNGFVVSEGCAVLVLEELEHARARGVTPIAEVIGYGSSSDAFHMAAPAERGEGSQRVDARGPGAGRHRPGGGRLHQCPRHQHAAQRPLRVGRPSRRSSASTPATAGGQLDQEHDRPHDGRRRRLRGLRLRSSRPDRLHPADHQPPPSRSGADARLRPERGPPDRQSASRSRTRWAWAATTAR